MRYTLLGLCLCLLVVCQSCAQPTATAINQANDLVPTKERSCVRVRLNIRHWRLVINQDGSGRVKVEPIDGAFGIFPIDTFDFATIDSSLADKRGPNVASLNCEVFRWYASNPKFVITTHKLSIESVAKLFDRAMKAIQDNPEYEKYPDESSNFIRKQLVKEYKRRPPVSHNKMPRHIP